MSNDRRVLPLVLFLSLVTAPARAEVLVRWDLDRVPSRESLGIAALVIPASKPEVVQEAAAKGFRVYLEVAAAALPGLGTPPEWVGGVVVRGTASPQQLDEVRRRLRSPGARVLSVDERGVWPHVRLNWVTMRNNVLQVSSRTAQPWIDSNAVFTRIAGARSGDGPLLLSYAWEPITVADTHRGPALENYLVAVAEAGSFGSDLVLPLHEGFQNDLLMGKPVARAEWQEIRRYLEFYSGDLPSRYRRVSNVAVIAADPMGSVEILRLLSRHNLPFELVTPDALRGDGGLKAFDLVIVLDPLEEAQAGPLAAFAKGGATVVLNGPAPRAQWAGAVQVLENDRQVTYSLGGGRLVTLRDPIADPDEFARDVRDLLGPDRRVVDVWNGITVMLAPYEEPGGDTVMITALNYAHQAQPIQVRVKGLFSTGHYESPESAPVLLPLRHRNGHTEFVLPALRVGGRVFLDHGDQPR